MVKVRDFFPCLSVVFMSRKYFSENKLTVHTFIFYYLIHWRHTFDGYCLS